MMTRKVPFFQIAIDNIVADMLSKSLLRKPASGFWENILDEYSRKIQLVVKEHEREVLPQFPFQEQVAYREAMNLVQAQGLNKLTKEILYIRGGKLDFSTS